MWQYGFARCDSPKQLQVQRSCKTKTKPRANRCLHILRTLRNEQHSQKDIDHLFKSRVLPDFIYGLPVYRASESDFTSIQNFLDRFYKGRFISFPVLINDLLNKQDCKIFKKAVSVDSHLLCPYIPTKKIAHTISEKNDVHALK